MNDDLLEPLSEDAKAVLYIPLHEQLKAAREAKGLSLRKLGNLAEVGHVTIWELESGANTCGLGSVLKICEALDLDLLIIPNKRRLTQ